MRSLRAAILAPAGLVLASCGPTASPPENNCTNPAWAGAAPPPIVDAASLPIAIDGRANVADQPNDDTHEVGDPPCSCDPFVVAMDGGDRIDTGLLDGSTGFAGSGGNELVMFEAWSKADRSDLVAGNLMHLASSCGGPPSYSCTVSYVATAASYEIDLAIPGEASRSVHIGAVSCGETSNLPSSGRTSRLHLANGTVLLGVVDQDFDLRVEDPIFSLNITFVTSGSTVCFRRLG